MFFQMFMKIEKYNATPTFFFVIITIVKDPKRNKTGQLLFFSKIDHLNTRKSFNIRFIQLFIYKKLLKLVLGVVKFCKTFKFAKID